MRRLLDERPADFVPAASELEARFVQLVRETGLPEPERQVDLGDDDGWIGRVDFAYPRHRLVVELDSERHHSAKLDIEADRARDQRLTAAGFRILRITWRQLHDRPDQVRALLWSLVGTDPHSNW